jgi:acyl-CoA thioester hydrolase
MSTYITTTKIIKEWTDYNEHMNMAYYVLIFDKAWEIVLKKFMMGEHSAKTTKKSTMVVETHTTYNQEVKQGDEVDIVLTYFDHDRKRLHFKMEMYAKTKKTLSATIEMLALYIDLNQRKVAEFENEKTKIMDEFIRQNKSNFKSENLYFSSKLKK